MMNTDEDYPRYVPYTSGETTYLLHTKPPRCITKVIKLGDKLNLEVVDNWSDKDISPRTLNRMLRWYLHSYLSGKTIKAHGGE